MSNISNCCSNNKNNKEEEECVLFKISDSQQISDIDQNSINDKSEKQAKKESIIPAEDQEQPLPQSNQEKDITSENATIIGATQVLSINSQTTAEEIKQIISINDASTQYSIRIDLQTAQNINGNSTLAQNPQNTSIILDSLVSSLDALRSVQTIQSLYITCNQNLTSIPFLRSLLSLITIHRSQLINLSLVFSNSNSSTETLAHISESLIGLSNLQTFSLNLASNPINKAKELGKLGKRLSNESTISQLNTLQLDLSGMHLGHANLRDYSQFILNNCDTLGVLDLCLSGCNIEKKGVEAIKNWIMHMKNVQQLNVDVSSNGLMDLFVKDMVRGFQGNQMDKLKQLKINYRGNYLTVEVTQFISLAISALSNMAYLSLNLSKNQINYAGLIRLVSVVQSAKSLEEYHLNLVGQRGGLVIGDVEEFTNNVKKAGKNLNKLTLDLQENQIQSGDVDRIIESFQGQERKEKEEQENSEEQLEFVLHILIEDEVAMVSQQKIMSKRIILGERQVNQ